MPDGLSLKGASDDDPLLKVDAKRHRIGLGPLANFRRYVAELVDGGDQILLTAVTLVTPNQVKPLQDAIASFAIDPAEADAGRLRPDGVQGPGRTLVKVDQRDRVSLGSNLLRHSMYLGTRQDQYGVRILLTPVMLMPAHLEHLINQKRELRDELITRTLRPR